MMSARKILVIPVLLVMFIFLSCKDKSAEQTELDKMHYEVMAVHDEVMPKISHLNRLSQQLKGKLVETDNEARADSINQAIEHLENADEGMMNWMYEFKKPDLNNFEAAKQYYENEMKKIETVKIDIKQSIEKAEKLLET